MEISCKMPIKSVLMIGSPRLQLNACRSFHGSKFCKSAVFQSILFSPDTSKLWCLNIHGSNEPIEQTISRVHFIEYSQKLVIFNFHRKIPQL